MDFIDRLLDYLETNMNLFTKFSVDFLPSSNQAITIRRTPSAPLTRYLDNSRDDVLSFQILVKHKKQTEAINTLQSIITTLEGLEEGAIQSQNNSFEFLKCELYTSLTLVEKDEKGCFIYTALFNTTLFIN